MVTLIRTGKIGRFGKLAIAIGFGVVMCGTVIVPAFAGGHGEVKHHEEHRDHDRHWDHDRNVQVAPVPSYYYAPPPDYYYAPEPSYYPPAYSAPPPPPSEGINLFFGGYH
jgi:hypothetical protein